MKNAVILAAGKGTRMKSDLPKVLHQVLKVPMVQLILNSLKEAGAERIITVTGYRHELVEQALAGQCEFALQDPQLGTGHAVMQARQLEHETGTVLVINGDAAVIQPETLKKLYEAVEHADMAVLTVSLENPSAYGRVIRKADGSVEKIVEFKDCTEAEKQVHEINTGIYAFRTEKLEAGLKEIRNDNAQHEYYITDLVEIFCNHGWKVNAVAAENPEEVQGVNDCAELAAASKWLRKQINAKWMKAGVQMMDPETAYIGPEVTFGHDVILHPCVELYGKTTVGNNAEIGMGTSLTDAEIPDFAKLGAVDKKAF